MGIFRHITKSILKLFIPEKHRFFIRWYASHYGILSTIFVYLKLIIKLPFTDVLTIQVKVPGSDVNVSMRPFEPELNTFDYVFLDMDYEIDCTDAKYIIDAGANVGLVSVYYALRYPGANILSIEPNDVNYDLLLSNTVNFPNIKTFKAALWGNNTSLSIVDKDERSWAYQVKDANGKGQIRAITLEYAMKEFDTEYIDILKLSILGSEIEVFESSSPWIGRMKLIVVELYDWLRPGCTEAMNNAIQGRDFIQTKRAQNTLLSNKNTNF